MQAGVQDVAGKPDTVNQGSITASEIKVGWHLQ